MHPTASGFVQAGMLVVVLGVVALFVTGEAYAARRLGRSVSSAVVLALGGSVIWMSLTGGLAASGVLARFDVRPPPIAFLFLGTIALGVALGVSRVGGRIAEGLPLHVLVLAQGFRLPLELIMHAAASEGTMPRVMSYGGYNFDIVTGASALLVGALLKRGAPRTLAYAWNALGVVLLLVIIGVALLSSPLVRAFGPDEVNTWVAYVPFVWLPSILVACAIAGHIVVWRRLAIELPVRPEQLG
jgi:small-conductance mechanosensitive channel